MENTKKTSARQAFSLSCSHAMLSFLLQKAGISFKVDNRLPNLVNLNEDPQLSEMLLYMLKEGNVFYSVFGTTRPFLLLLLYYSRHRIKHCASSDLI